MHFKLSKYARPACDQLLHCLCSKKSSRKQRSAGRRCLPLCCSQQHESDVSHWFTGLVWGASAGPAWGMQAAGTNTRSLCYPLQVPCGTPDDLPGCLGLDARADNCVSSTVEGLHGLPSCLLPDHLLLNAVARIALVKPDKARGVENMVLQMAQRGQLTEKVRSTHHKVSNMPGTSWKA